MQCTVRASITVLCLLVLAPTKLALAADTGNPDRIQVDSELASALVDNLERLISQIDRSQFEIEPLLDRLSYDEQEIIAFVSSEIAFEEYPGTLRGATGTLQSRAGNSLDQAILLGKLLKDAGLDARIVEGVIPHTALQQPIRAKRPESPGAFMNVATLEQILSNLSGRAAQPSDARPNDQDSVVEVSFSAPRAVSETTDSILKALQTSGVQMSAERDKNPGGKVPYFWVEYRDGPSQAWAPLHPVFGNGAPEGLNTKPVRYITESIDPSLQQRISVQAFIERSWNGRRETIAVTRAHEYPAANLSGLTVGYTVLPSSALANDIKSPEDALKAVAESTMFFPVFDFGNARPKLAFDLEGNVLPIEDAASSMAPLFQTMGSKMGTAFDALASDGKRRGPDDKPNRYVTRHWVEFTITRPGLEPKRLQRNIARWEDDESHFRTSVARVARFRIEAGATSPARFLDRRLRGMKTLIQNLVSGNAPQTEEGGLDRVSADTETFLLVSDLIARQSEPVLLYRAEPSIVAHYSPFGHADTSREGFDIISMPRRAISLQDGLPRPEAVVRNGVTDTWLEQSLFADISWQQDSAFQRLTAKALAHTNDTLTVLNATNLPVNDAIPDPARTLIEQTLETRDLVLMTGPPETCDAWWRVNPRTGESLGILPSGWGGAYFTLGTTLQEYIADLVAVYGPIKVGSAVMSCTAVVAFIKASAAINGLNLFQLNDALGHRSLDLCSIIPNPSLQGLCTIVVASAAIASTAPAATLSNEVLTMICLRSVFL